jgi:diazepam-binding inhibitor (GABA receptor modulating acyl-CoA-binding protein)
MSQELIEEFNSAVSCVNNTLPKHPLSNDVKLDFYKYYKQVTIGDCNITQPWGFQIEARAKWEAWNNIKGTTKENAILSYCELYMNYY